MIVVDIGNTNIVVGIYSGKKIKKIVRFDTKDNNIINSLKFLFNTINIIKLKLDYKICTMSSVVPTIDKKIINFFKSLDFKVLNIKISNIPLNIKFNYEAKQIGSDRIANTYAAIKKYGNNSIVIDFGTATTFDVIKNKTYEGGIISPGINISHNALIKKASKLKKISIVRTNSIVGKNTKSSLQSGFYWGYISLINGIINKIIYQKKFEPNIILTGGLAKIFKKEINFKTYYEPNLTLDGLYLIGQIKYA